MRIAPPSALPTIPASIMTKYDGRRRRSRKGGLVLGSSDYFKPVSTWTVEEVRAVLRERSAESYNLVDVRQPQEYASGHLPGARLIPIAELSDRLGDLDRSKPTITY